MKRNILLFLSLLFLISASAFGQTVVDRYGRLQKFGSNICAEDGEQITLAGNSFYWSNWDDKYYNANTVNFLVDDMKSSIVRAAMAVGKEGNTVPGGYIDNPGGSRAKVEALVDQAIARGVYVIIDWHVEGDTRGWKEQAKGFFSDMAQKYGANPNIIYEIWNEPTHTNWGEIKPYAEEVIAAIRQHDPDNLIIVGTETWSQRVDDASRDQINDPNIAYTMHFYPDDPTNGAAHREQLRAHVNTAMNLGAAIFVTEWGGNDTNFAESDVWMNFLKEKKISHCMWAVNDKTADPDWNWSIFNGGTPANGPYNLRGPGNYLKNLMASWPYPSNEPIVCTVHTVPGRVEAEGYCTQSGVQKEITEDSNGGQNVGFIDAGDWMEYTVNVASTGNHNLAIRVAGESGSKSLDILQDGALLKTVTFDATGGWQAWATVNTTVNLTAGEHTIRIAANTDGFNLNYFDYSFECQNPALSSVEITPANPTVLTGESIQLTATGKNDCGGDVAAAITWSANAPNGLFSGTTSEVVTATSGAFSDQVSVTVTAENATLISDAEHEELSLMNTKWFSFNDNGDGGASTIIPLASDEAPFTMSAGGANGTDNATVISYTLNQGSLEFDPYVGFGFDMNAGQTAFDLSGSTGISFYHRGEACKVVVPLSSNTDPDFYTASVASHTEWTKVTVNWTQLAQNADWGVDVAWNAASILKFQWQVSASSGAGTVGIDQVKIEGKTFATPDLPGGCDDFELLTIDIAPSAVTIALGQTVQFTASGSSSCQSIPVNTTCTWSANAFNGLFTATELGVFTITASEAGITGSATVTVVPESDVVAPGLIEAENFASVEGTVEIEDSGEGSPNVGFFDAGEVLHYTVDVPQGFNAKISLRVATDTGGDLILGTNNGELMTVQIPATGGWTTYNTVIVSLDLPASNDFTLSTTTGSVNINWLDIQINDCANPGLATLTVIPANPSVMPGAKVQLYASGVDGCGVVTATNAVWSANAPNGLYTAGASEGFDVVTVTAGGITQNISVAIARPSKVQDFVVNAHGRLQVGGNKVFGKNGEVVSLAGNSLFWSGSSPTWYTRESVDWLVSDWNTQVIRPTMSVHPRNDEGPWNTDDYKQNPEYQMQLMTTVIDAAIANDIYVIVDFHEHYAEEFTAEAVTFFGDIAEMYGDYDNVIYEIYNEPINQSWGTIKAYAETVIAEIRKHDPDNLIIVGTGFYSQEIHEPEADPINDNNVAYTLHGYAIANHGALRKEYSVPIVGTEWGIAVNDNGGGETGAWVDYWRNNQGGLIHCMWAVNNKHVDGDENWSILNTGVEKAGNWTDSDLSTSGHTQKGIIQGWTNLRPTPIVNCNPAMVAVTLSPSNPSVVLGESIQLSATGRDECNNAVSPGTITWSANAPNGLFAGNTEGSFLVTASANGFNASATVIVSQETATLISNAEHGQLSLMNSKWYSYNDNPDGGASIVTPLAGEDVAFTMTAGGASGTDNATKIDYTLNQGGLEFDPYLGFGFDMNADESAFDLSGSTGVSFYHKGDACFLQVPLSTNADPDYYTATVAAHGDWTKVTLTWAQFAQSAEWGVDVAWNAANVLKFQWQVQAASGSGSVSVDEVKIEGIVFQTPLTDEVIAVTDLVVSGCQTALTVGDSFTFSADVLPANANDKSVSYNSSNSAIASVDANGFVSAIAAGTATITATSNDGGFSGECTVAVASIPVIAVTGIEMDPLGSNLEVGTTLQLSATISPANATNQQMTWSTNEAEVASVDANGLVTGNSAGLTTIFATSVDGGFRTQVVVAVNTPSCSGDVIPGTVQAEDFEDMSGITAGANDIGWLDAGDWIEYDVSVQQTASYNVTFRVANGIDTQGQLQIAMDGVNTGGVLSVGNTGGWANWTDMVLSDVSLTAGCHTMRINVLQGPTNIDYYHFVVNAPAELTSLEVTPSDAGTISVGQSVQFTATALDQFGAVFNGASISWSVAGNCTDCITSNGLFTGDVTGDYTITAVSGTIQSSATVTVSDEEPFTVRIEAESFVLMLGIQTESTSDTGGGQNVGYIDAGDWMSYQNVNIPASGTYTVSYRIASQNGGGHINLEKEGGTVNYGSISIPSTGGWQNWTTVSHTVQLTAGVQSFGIAATSGGFNFNWFEITSGANNARTIDTESADDLFSTEAKVSLYPNPVSNSLTVSGTGNYHTMRILGIDGKTQLLQSLNDLETLQLDVSSLNKGVYIMQLSSDNGQQTLRFVKR
ncbi:MAG: carbohydrate-binding protein [Reichenbachiella sp.]